MTTDAQVLARNFSDDLSMDSFPGEIVQFVRSPRVETARHLPIKPSCLCMMVKCCSGERSFSKLALIKNDLRSTMRHDQPSSLCLLSIDSELLNNLNFEEVVQNKNQNQNRFLFRLHVYMLMLQTIYNY